MDPDKFRGLACAQSPKTMVIGCCDSRVDPALLLGTSPGDIFVVRNGAALRARREAGAALPAWPPSPPGRPPHPAALPAAALTLWWLRSGQPCAALRAPGRLPRHVGGAGVCGDGAQG